MRYVSRIFRDRTGAALVEFTLLLPLLVIMMAGMVEFGRAISQYHTAQKGVKSAARYLARTAKDTTCPPSGADWAVAEGKAKSLAMRGSFNAADPYRLANWSDQSSIAITVQCLDNTSDAYRGGDNLLIIKVSSEFDFNDLGMLGLTEVPGLSNLKIRAAHEEMNVGG